MCTHTLRYEYIFIYIHTCIESRDEYVLVGPIVIGLDYVID